MNSAGTSSSQGPRLSELPDSQSTTLRLTHPTASERRSILTANAAEWGGGLTVEDYVEIGMGLATNPDANLGGLTEWILVEWTGAPNRRLIFASCETYVKRALVKDFGPLGDFKEGIVHGIASVFCASKYRGRGYAKRMLRELRLVLGYWKTDDDTECVGSVLWSDIGKNYYKALGWTPGINVHLEFPAVSGPTAPLTPKEAGGVNVLRANDLSVLCSEDMGKLWKSFLRMRDKEGPCMAIIPDHTHILWHHIREEVVIPKIRPYSWTWEKGAIAGQPGSRVWAIWTHHVSRKDSYSTSEGTLYILRLVVERPDASEKCERDLSLSEKEQLALNLKIVLQSAQAEAAKWTFGCVKLWNPSSFVKELITQAGIEYSEIERERECIGSLKWYGPGDEENVEWIGNERYAWC